MVKEAVTCGGRKCSHCGYNGHNSRTCNGKGCVKLFGVYVSENSRASMKKSLSVENMRSSSCNKSSELAVVDPRGYLSDDPNHHSQEAKAARERKKGKPWSMEEHVTFLEGLKRLGKGDWRGISKNFVPTRTPTQVASHAQKYFLRQVINDKKKRRTSMFDLHSQDHDHDDASPDSSVTFPKIVKEATASTASHSQKQNALQVVDQFPYLCLDNPSVGPCLARGTLRPSIFVSCAYLLIHAQTVEASNRDPCPLTIQNSPVDQTCVQAIAQPFDMVSDVNLQGTVDFGYQFPRATILGIHDLEARRAL
ncbi:probable transcription factor At5g61620 [Eucalyptus grandis]|uniref:probable transcription factor At5g61620 n=1 Tax=Eucalyptus grandis TaxID=71139 RepID=UPI00192EB45B|nr:probable transcription factor At5g61620 [Eucalyptus grandis]